MRFLQNILLNFQGISDKSKYICQRFAGKILKKYNHTNTYSYRPHAPQGKKTKAEKKNPLQIQSFTFFSTDSNFIFSVCEYQNKRKTLIISSAVKVVMAHKRKTSDKE